MHGDIFIKKGKGLAVREGGGERSRLNQKKKPDVRPEQKTWAEFSYDWGDFSATIKCEKKVRTESEKCALEEEDSSVDEGKSQGRKKKLLCAGHETRLN